MQQLHNQKNENPQNPKGNHAFLYIVCSLFIIADTKCIWKLLHTWENINYCIYLLLLLSCGALGSLSHIFSFSLLLVVESLLLRELNSSGGHCISEWIPVLSQNKCVYRNYFWCCLSLESPWFSRNLCHVLHFLYLNRDGV